VYTKLYDKREKMELSFKFDSNGNETLDEHLDTVFEVRKW